jgi:hypothetical protein
MQRKGRLVMISIRNLGVSVLGVVLSTYAVNGQAGANYREFRFGSDVASVSALTGVSASQAKTLHERPAMLQELQWRRGYRAPGPGPADSVREFVFSFYNDQLFRLVIDYDHDRTAGMTDTDMIDAISTIYGSTLKPLLGTGGAQGSEGEDDSGTRIARWGDAEYSAVLYRSSFYTSRFRMIVTDVRLHALARTAEVRALQLDEREAPQREIARQKKEADETRAAEEKSRAANKAVFKP